jgi:hypothetical protein
MTPPAPLPGRAPAAGPAAPAPAAAPATPPPPAPVPLPRRVRLDIGAITLHGYSPAQQDRFTRSLRAELAELAAGPEAAQAAASPAPPPARRLDAGVLRAGATPEEAAGRVAAALRAHLAAEGAAPGGPERPGQEDSHV